MKKTVSRRSVLAKISAAAAALVAAPAAKAAKATVQKLLVRADAPKDYDASKHQWVMAIDAEQLHRLWPLCRSLQERESCAGRPILSDVGRALHHCQAQTRDPVRFAGRRW
jgi:flavoprotein